MHPIRVQPAIVASAKAMATMPAMIVGVKLFCGVSDGGCSVGFRTSGCRTDSVTLAAVSSDFVRVPCLE